MFFDMLLLDCQANIGREKNTDTNLFRYLYWLPLRMFYNIKFA